MGLEQRPGREITTKIYKALGLISPDLRARGKAIQKKMSGLINGEITNSDITEEQLLKESYQWRQDLGKILYGDQFVSQPDRDTP